MRTNALPAATQSAAKGFVCGSQRGRDCSSLQLHPVGLLGVSRSSLRNYNSVLVLFRCVVCGFWMKWLGSYFILVWCVSALPVVLLLVCKGGSVVYTNLIVLGWQQHNSFFAINV